MRSGSGEMASLSFAIFGRWELERLFVIVTAYMDASGTHEGAPVSVLAGYVGRKNQWRVFDRRWKKEFKKRGVDYYHTKELRDRHGQYAGWEDDKAQAHINKLAMITHDETLFGFTVSIRQDEYNKHYRNAERPNRIQHDSMYGLCYRVFLDFIPQYVLNARIEKPELYVVQEAGDAGIGDCARITEEFRKYGPSDTRGLIKVRSEGAKKDYYGLQAADLLASGTYQHENEDSIGGLRPIPREYNLASRFDTLEGESRIVRLTVTPDVLNELRAHLFMRRELRREISERLKSA